MAMASSPVTATEREILLLLLIGPLQHERDLEYLLNHRPKTLYETIMSLLARGVIGEVSPACIGRPRRLLYLTSRGMRLLLSTTSSADVAWFAYRWRANLHGLSHLVLRLPVVVTLQELLDPLITAIHDAIAKSFAPLGYHEHHWFWVRNYLHLVRTAKNSDQARDDGRRTANTIYQARADGLVVLDATLRHPHQTGIPDHYRVCYAAWILLDPGIGAMDAIRAQLEPIYRFRNRQRAEGIAAFPPLWVVTRSPYRASIWRRAARSIERDLKTDPLCGIIHIAPPTNTTCWPLNALGEPSKVPMGDTEWTRLDTGERATLGSLFEQPLPIAALPPHIIPPMPIPNESEQAPVEVVDQQQVTRPIIERLEDRLERARARSPKGRISEAGMAHIMLHLTRRKLQILDLLAAHPLLAMEDLANLLDITNAHCLQTSHLQDLENWGLIRKTTVPCQRLAALRPDPTATEPVPNVTGLSLSPDGWRLLSTIYHIPHKHLSSAQDAEVLIAHAATHGAHTIGVYKFFSWLVAAARQQNSLHRLLWWESGAACIRKVGIKPNSSEVVIIRPDGIGEYAWGNRRMRFWLEWDMDTERRSELETKFFHYAAYARSRRYWNEHPRSLPVLLVVVPSAQRERKVAEALQALIDRNQLAPQEHLTIRSTTFLLLGQHGPLGAIWRPLLPRSPEREANAVPTSISLLDSIRPLPPNVD